MTGRQMPRREDLELVVEPEPVRRDVPEPDRSGWVIVWLVAAVLVALAIATVVAVLLLAPTPRSDARPGAPGPVSGERLIGAPATAPSRSGTASLGSVSAVGSDAPYPADPPLSAAGAPQPLTGTANFARPSHGADYLAMRLPRGTVVTICGAGGCWVGVVNDFGPVEATGDIADIALVKFARICGWSIATARRMGECVVTVTRGGPDLPATDQEEAP
jgi:hypothetical protein